MSPRLIRRVQRIEALLGEPIGYDGPEGLHPGPGGAERVELVHPSGRPAAWLVSPSLSPERRSALRALTSERLLLIDAIERERRRPGVTDILRRLTGCEEALTAARTVRDVAERIQSGLQGLLGVLDRDALEIEVHPVGDDDPGVARGAGGAPGVCLGPDGRSLRFVVGPPGRGRFAVDLRRPAGVEPTQAAVLNREHTSACALFQRQLDATLAAWHLAFLERVTGDVIDAFHRDRARDPSAGGVAARSSALRDTAAALAVALDARGVRVVTSHRATLTREVRGEAGTPGARPHLRVPLVPEHAMATEGEPAHTCLPIGEIELTFEHETDGIGWGSLARELAVRLADALCTRRRLRLAERALEPVTGPAWGDPWQALVERLRADLALSAACVAGEASGDVEIVVCAAEDAFREPMRAALRAAWEASEDGWEQARHDDLELWRLPLPGVAPHAQRHLVIAARREAAWPVGSHVLRQRDREFARHLLGPFLAQLQTLEAIPHGALLLRDGDALNGVANARARQILRDAGQHDEQVEVVRQMAAESTAAGIPAWVPVDGMGVLVWRPAGTASDLLLFSPLDGMLALDRALTIDRLTSTSFLHHLRTLVKVTHTGVRGLHDLLTHGATSTIGEALSIWPPRLPDSAVLIERLLRGDRAPSAVSAVRRWRDLGFDHVGHHVEELVAAACEPGEGFSDAEARLMGAVEGSARPPLIADALLRLAQLAHYQRSLEATLRPLEANSRLLDPRAGPVRDRTLHFLAEDLADMGRVMAALERPAIEVTFDPVDAPGDRALPDARLIEHAVLNLMSNAIHAVAKVGGGHVRVSMKERGAHLMIEVHDDGAPLPPAIAAAPYLPPSADAEARGWGLHLTYAIAKRAGGHMPPPALGAVEGDPARQPKSFRLVLPFAGGAGHA